ncbi:VOC family protein [Mycolicibacterium porcinum]|uniref:VOC family protein n=1 Tax=Mycolicibacterium porcinum TaxID=39693 RepID=UPI00226A3C49|nr:VOC family protein [Mycolicibacterium porcinum]
MLMRGALVGEYRAEEHLGETCKRTYPTEYVQFVYETGSFQPALRASFRLQKWSEMTESTFHHVGVLVPDMAKAIQWFNDVLGLDFGEPQVMTTQGRIDPGEYGDNEQHQGSSCLAWSRQGPPWIELAEAKGTGLHSLERHGAGLHHIGVFVDSVDEVLRRVEPLGMQIEGMVAAPDGTTMVCWMQPAQESGVLVEYIDERLRGGMQRWIDTGEPPAVPGAVAAS